MKRNLRLYCSIAAVSLFFITSCASTTLLSTWKDDSYQGNIKEILIIGVAERPGIRRMFEREFSNQLTSHGITAYASNQILPSDEILDKSTIVSKITEMEIDAILITRLVDRRTVSTHSSDWFNHYTRSFGRTFQDEHVNLETHLYDAETEALVWSALSETVIMEGQSTFDKIGTFIGVIVRRLSQDGLI